VFPQDADDAVWLSEAGQRWWIVLMKDEPGGMCGRLALHEDPAGFGRAGP